MGGEGDGDGDGDAVGPGGAGVDVVHAAASNPRATIGMRNVLGGASTGPPACGPMRNGG